MGLTFGAAPGSIGSMHVRITSSGVSVELSPGEALALMEQIGDMPARDRPKVRQLHQQIEMALAMRARGAKGV